MSLLQFHIVLISAAILLSAGLGFWGIHEYEITHSLNSAATAGVSFLTGIGFVIYLVWFVAKKLPRFKE